MSMTSGSAAVGLLYDGDGNRMAKTVGGVTTRYLVDDLNPTGLPQVVDELVGGAVTRQYTYGLDRISENQPVSGTWMPSFYEIDGAGSVRQLTNSTGTVTDSYEYDAFGNKINSTGTTPNSYLYRGEQYDPDLSLYYLRARYFNQATGRFLNVDPLAGDGQRRYEYAAADPVDGMDPTGNQVLFEYRPLIPPPLYWNPKFCFSGAGGSPMSEYLPSCTGPAGPPTPPHKKVKVFWRPLLKGMIGHPPTHFTRSGIGIIHILKLTRRVNQCQILGVCLAQTAGERTKRCFTMTQEIASIMEVAARMFLAQIQRRTPSRTCSILPCIRVQPALRAERTIITGGGAFPLMDITATLIPTT
jgi:RHS repeat-associated protein